MFVLGFYSEPFMIGLKTTFN